MQPEPVIVRPKSRKKAEKKVESPAYTPLSNPDLMEGKTLKGPKPLVSKRYPLLKKIEI